MIKYVYFLVFFRNINEEYVIWGKMDVGKLFVEIDFSES